MNEEKLARGIVARAVDDYKEAFLGYTVEAYKSAEATEKECEIFFKSRWCSLLTNLNGEWIMKNVKREELKKLIEAYTKALAREDLTFTERVDKKKVKVTIPPKLVGPFKVLLREQLKEMQRELMDLERKGEKSKKIKKRSQIKRD